MVSAGAAEAAELDIDTLIHEAGAAQLEINFNHGDPVRLADQVLVFKRIVRQVTPIFDTRALGYSSMLVAAKVDPERPHRAAQVINRHPGVSHNYLRTHEFNLWFTIATEPDSKLGLDGTLEVLAERRQRVAEYREQRLKANPSLLSTPFTPRTPPAG